MYPDAVSTLGLNDEKIYMGHGFRFLGSNFLIKTQLNKLLGTWYLRMKSWGIMQGAARLNLFEALNVYLKAHLVTTSLKALQPFTF